MSHQDTIRDQFTRQAVPFSQAPSIRDEAALVLLVEAAGAAAGQRTLDVACGPGLVACAFARVVAHATGIDATPAMIARARRLQLDQGLSNIEWQVGAAEQLPFEADRFDIVTCRFAFHHFEQPSRVLAEMIRVALPGGAVLVCDGFASDNAAKAAAFNTMERLRDPSTVRFLTLAELHTLFCRCRTGVAGGALLPRSGRARRLDEGIVSDRRRRRHRAAHDRRLRGG